MNDSDLFLNRILQKESLWSRESVLHFANRTVSVL